MVPRQIVLFTQILEKAFEPYTKVGNEHIIEKTIENEGMNIVGQKGVVHLSNSD